jgi:WD40 repeat protein
VRYARFAEGGKSLLLPYSDIWRVDVATGNGTLLGKENKWPMFDVSPDGRFVLVVENVYGSPGSTNVLTCRPAANPVASAAIWERAVPGASVYAPRYLASGDRFLRVEGGWSASSNRSEYQFVTYDAATGEVLAKSPTIPQAMPQPIISPDGRWVVGSYGVWLHYWPVESDTGTAGHLKNDNRRHFTDVAFHPSGKYLAVTSNDATVKLYDTTTWEQARAFTWQIGQMRSIAFSPDGTLAAAGNGKGEVVVWDVDL